MRMRTVGLGQVFVALPKANCEKLRVLREVGEVESLHFEPFHLFCFHKSHGYPEGSLK